jgi:hypothetical protein
VDDIGGETYSLGGHEPHPISKRSIAPEFLIQLVYKITK